MKLTYGSRIEFKSGLKMNGSSTFNKIEYYMNNFNLEFTVFTSIIAFK